jgi:hypothetical protein
VCILIKIFEDLGVLEKPVVDDWLCKPINEQRDVATATHHFKEGNKFRLIKEAKALKTVLEANAATAKPEAVTKPDTMTTTAGHGMEGWSYYCWSHGICKHSGVECNQCKPGHKTEACVSWNYLETWEGLR